MIKLIMALSLLFVTIHGLDSFNQNEGNEDSIFHLLITLTTQISIILRQLIFGAFFFHYGPIPNIMLNFCLHKFINFAPFLMLLQLISGNLSPYYAYYQPYAYSSG